MYFLMIPTGKCHSMTSDFQIYNLSENSKLKLLNICINYLCLLLVEVSSRFGISFVFTLPSFICAHGNISKPKKKQNKKKLKCSKSVYNSWRFSFQEYTPEVCVGGIKKLTFVLFLVPPIYCL